MCNCRSDKWTLVDAEGNITPEEHGTSPIVSPLTLAASLSVDSCYMRAHIPSVQISVSAARINLHLSAHLTHLGQGQSSYYSTFNCIINSGHIDDVY